jgi:transcriptional regulator with XRE-family HTH domain
MGQDTRVATVSSLGRLLREWRTARGVSQFELALRADISARHLSFVETGRAQPGRDVVLRLASALDLPLRERNAALRAAGYAQIYRQESLSAPGMAPVVRALDFMLRQQEPYPAMVIDRLCGVTRMNRAAERFVTLFLGQVPEPPVNLARLLFDPEGLRPYILNWDEMAQHVLLRIRRDLSHESPGSPAMQLFEELMAIPGLPEACRVFPLDSVAPPIVPTEFRKDGRTYRLFTTLTSFGTPQDVTLQELRIESSFPADEETDVLLRELAGDSPSVWEVERGA